MAIEDTGPDTAQRIARALSLTSDPHPPRSGFKPDTKEYEIIGTVPQHLRHLHNLTEQLADEVMEAQHILTTRIERLTVVRELLSDSLKMQMPKADEASKLFILENWEVAASFKELEVQDLLDALKAYRMR